MTRARTLAIGLLVLIFAVSLFAGFVAPAPYAAQFRDFVSALDRTAFGSGPTNSAAIAGRACSMARASRCCWRRPLRCSPTLMAVVIGGIAGYAGGWWDRVVRRVIDHLPLHSLAFSLSDRSRPVAAQCVAHRPPSPSPSPSWASSDGLQPPASSALAHNRCETPISSLHARACGCTGPRLVFVHIAPNLKPVIFAQFWIAIPTFILGEASLGLIGLGVAEPLPILGKSAARTGQPASRRRQPVDPRATGGSRHCRKLLPAPPAGQGVRFMKRLARTFAITATSLLGPMGWRFALLSPLRSENLQSAPG